MKKLIQNRRSAGWNLIEIIVAVAIGASIAAAGVAAYQGEAKKATLAKAKAFISDVESKKAALLADIETGNPPSGYTDPDVNGYVLPQIKVQGTALTGVGDAPKMGFATIDCGSLDTLSADGTTVTKAGTPAKVTLNDGTVLFGSANPSS